MFTWQVRLRMERKLTWMVGQSIDIVSHGIRHWRKVPNWFFVLPEISKRWPALSKINLFYFRIGSRSVFLSWNKVRSRSCYCVGLLKGLAILRLLRRMCIRFMWNIMSASCYNLRIWLRLLWLKINREILLVQFEWDTEGRPESNSLFLCLSMILKWNRL